MIQIPNLTIDQDGADADALVCLQQESLEGEGHQVVYLHQIQVRLLAERSGMLPPSSNLEADRTIARLCRQMRTLADRIAYLDDWLHNCSDTAHADLDYEQGYSEATWDLAREFVQELPDAEDVAAPAPALGLAPTPTPAPRPAPTPAPAPAPAPVARDLLPLEAGEGA